MCCMKPCRPIEVGDGSEMVVLPELLDEESGWHEDAFPLLAWDSLNEEPHVASVRGKLEGVPKVF